MADNFKDLVRQSFELITGCGNKDGVAGLPSGLTDFDRITGGFHSGDLIIVAGRPSMGKSTLVLNVVEHVSIVKKAPVGIFITDRSKEQLVFRILCSCARVNAHRARRGFLEKGDPAKLAAASEKLSESSIFIDDVGVVSIDDLRDRAGAFVRAHDVKLIVLDDLYYLLQNDRKDSAAKHEIARALKMLAIELDVPIIATANINRAAESRWDHKPHLADLRDNGSLEVNADMVLMLFREDYYDHNANPDEAYVIIAKNKRGSTGEVRVSFLAEYMRFEDFDGNEDDEI